MRNRCWKPKALPYKNISDVTAKTKGENKINKLKLLVMGGTLRHLFKFKIQMHVCAKLIVTYCTL